MGHVKVCHGFCTAFPANVDQHAAPPQRWRSVVQTTGSKGDVPRLVMPERGVWRDGSMTLSLVVVPRDAWEVQTFAFSATPQSVIFTIACQNAELSTTSELIGARSARFVGRGELSTRGSFTSALP